MSDQGRNAWDSGDGVPVPTSAVTASEMLS
jgi:hypothetical protein